MENMSKTVGRKEHHCRKPVSLRVLLVALFSLIVRNLANEHAVFLRDAGHLTSNIVYVLYVYILIGLLLLVFEHLRGGQYRGIFLKTGQVEKIGRSLSWDRKSIRKATLIIFCVCLFWAIVYYPAQLHGDTFYMINDLVNGTQEGGNTANWYSETPYFINAHHPIIDTFFYSVFYLLGRAAGHVNLGVFACALVQGLAGSAVCAVMLCSLTLLHVHPGIIGAGFLYVTLMPFVPVYMVSLCKDSTFSILFILYMTVYLQIFLRGGSVKKWRWLLISSLLITVTKQVGVYIALLSGIFMLFSRKLRKSRRQILICAALPCVVWFGIFPHIIYPALNVRVDDAHEVLGLPAQQVALTVILHGDELSEEEKTIIDRLYPYDQLEKKFRYDLTDPVKNSFRRNTGREEIRTFLKLWVKLGFEHPKTYISALSGLCGGYFTTERHIDLIGHLRLYNQHYLNLSVPHRWEELNNFVKDLYLKLIQQGLLGLPFLMVIYAFWMPLYIVDLSIRRRNGTMFLAGMPLYLSVGVLLLSPHVVARYALPLILTAPLMAAMSDILRQ